MASLHTFMTIARFEMKTLLRSWFFRIFAGISIITSFIFNFVTFFNIGSSEYLFKAIPSVIPYVSLLVINLGQAIVAIFLASEFLKQDNKNDTVEVIYARSMSNATYILGKTTGILFVFMILNILVLLLGSVFVYLNNPSSLSILDISLYPLLISFPTLIFVLGLSFLLMILFKNQAITFIVLLGYVAISLFYLNEKLYHIFDYIAYTVPMMNSTISGFGDINQVLLHRGIYFFLGLGFIFLTIYRLNRLPQAKIFRSFPLIVAIVFILIGAYMAKSFVDVKSEEISLKKQMIALNDKYYDKATISILNCNLDLKHRNDKIFVLADLEVQNNEADQLDELILSLNPKLKVKEIKSGNQVLTFKHEIHILKIDYPASLKFKEKCKLQIRYEGGISELTNALDQSLVDYSDSFNLNIIRIKKRYAFLDKEFVCLTKESLWYPIAGVGFTSKNPAYMRREFSNFSLKVETLPYLNVVSQGSKRKISDGQFIFKTDYPIPQISLLIGKYKELSIKVDSIEYFIYSIEGNDGFKKQFSNINDTLPSLIKTYKDEYETKIELNYPFKRFIFAEVPIQFSLANHNWSISSDALQPEMLLYPEKGVLFNDVDFAEKRKIINGEGGGGRGARWARMQMGAGNEEYSEEEKDAMILSTFIRNNFFATKSQGFSYENIVNYNTFSLFPHYYSFRTNLMSKEWPMLGISIGSYLKDKNESNNVFNWKRWRGITFLDKQNRINLTLKKYSLKEILKTGIQEAEIPDSDKISINEIINTKGNYLLTLLASKYGTDEFYSFIKSLIKENTHQSFDYAQFRELIKDNFKEDIDPLLAEWYQEKEVPGFIVDNIETYQVKDGEYTNYQVRFNVSNPEPTDGLVTIEIALGRGWGRMSGANPPFTKDIYMKGGDNIEVGYTFTQKPSILRVFTYISQNLPQNLQYNLSDFDENRDTKPINGIRPLTAYTSTLASNEIIVDNEDSGFDTYQLDNKSYLKSLIDKNRKAKTYDYELANWKGAPRRWEAVIKTDYYGKYIHSAEYTKTNDHLRKAIWKVNIKKSGTYDIYCHLDKKTGWGARWIPDASYNFIIHSGDGVNEKTLYEEDIQKGWNYLGTYNITSDTSIVELTNKSTGVSIFADAIKWVEN